MESNRQVTRLSQEMSAFRDYWKTRVMGPKATAEDRLFYITTMHSYLKKLEQARRS